MSRCGHQVLWATTVPAGKRIPLEVQACHPDDQGAMFLVDGKWAYSLRELADRLARRLELSWDRALDHAKVHYPAHKAHFTTCDRADQLRAVRG
jgi:hypothetical protein